MYPHLKRKLVRPGQLGVFATLAIPAGTILFPDWHNQTMEGWVCLSPLEMSWLPEYQYGLFRCYGLDVDFEKIRGPLHHRYVKAIDNFINHSCAPNLIYDLTGNVIAGRDVAAGEEVRIDYGSFCVNLNEVFNCGCGATDCRGRVTRWDWKLLVERGCVMPPFVRRALKGGAYDNVYRGHDSVAARVRVVPG